MHCNTRHCGSSLMTALLLGAGSASAADLFIPGVLREDFYSGATRVPVENNQAGAPTRTSYWTAFEGPVNAYDNFTRRVSGVFIPPESGNYVFFTCSDDDSDLFLSTDADPANKRLVAQETAWSNNRQWVTSGGSSNLASKRSDQISIGGTTPFAAGIPLVKGQRYYIEGVQHEGGGGDNHSVTYSLVGSEPADDDATLLNAANNNIGIVVPQPTSFTITADPANASVFAGTKAVFTAAAVANTTIAPTYQWRKNDQNIPGATLSTYTHQAVATDNNAKFDCVITLPLVPANLPGITNPLTTAKANLEVKTGVTVTGLKEEFFAGAVRADVESGAVSVPTRIAHANGFEFTDVSDNFARRVSGYFTPAVSGQYVFFVSSDDDSDLFISTDANPANKRLIAQETGWSNFRTWLNSGDGSDNGGSVITQKRSDQWSPDAGATVPYATGITLTANQKYYIEGVHHEGGGGDNFAATFKLMSDEDPANGTASALTGSVVSYLTAPVTFANIATEPTSVAVYEDQRATFTVVMNTDSELSPVYQWRRNGDNIQGANSASYSLVTTLADNGAKFDCIITVPNFAGTFDSADATLTVNAALLVTGNVKQEIWPNDSTTRAAVEGRTAPAPATTTYIQAMATTDFADNYVQRLSGLFLPPATGDYVFFLASDDDSSLWLSTDSTPANRRQIAAVTSWDNAREWTVSGGASNLEQKRSDSFTPDGGATVPFASGIHLEKGQRYYIETVHHEGGGGDNAAVTFKLIGEDDPANGSAAKVSGTAIGVLAPAPTKITIVTGPTNTTVTEHHTATFTVNATADGILPPAYQWRRNSQVIPGAIGSSYSPFVSKADDGAKFDVVVAVPGFTSPTETTAAATVTVVSGEFEGGVLNQELFANSNRANVESFNTGAPVLTDYTSFEAPVDMADNYARRVSGYFIPPTSGAYVFFVCSDDDSDLFLSTDENPANKRLIAQETSWSNNRQWVASGGSSSLSQKRSDQYSPDGGTTVPFASGIQLNANQRYFIQGVQHEGGGGDNFSATFKLLADADPEDGTATALTGAVIGRIKPATVSGPTVSTTIPTGLAGTPLTGVVLDQATKTITADIPAGGLQGYLTITPAVVITSVTIENGKLVIKYQ